VPFYPLRIPCCFVERVSLFFQIFFSGLLASGVGACRCSFLFFFDTQPVFFPTSIRSPVINRRRQSLRSCNSFFQGPPSLARSAHFPPNVVKRPGTFQYEAIPGPLSTGSDAEIAGASFCSGLFAQICFHLFGSLFPSVYERVRC